MQQGDFTYARAAISAQKILTAVDSLLKEYPEIEDEFTKLAQALYPSISQVLSAQQHGHEIASHSHSHYFRDSVANELYEQDLLKSQQTLNAIGVTPQSYSYPYNRYIADDEKVASQYYDFISTVNSGAIDATTKLTALPRNTWPGKAKNSLRHRRWLLTGHL